MNIRILVDAHLRKREQEMRYLKNKAAHAGIGFSGNYIHRLYELDLKLFEEILNRIWENVFAHLKVENLKRIKNWNDSYAEENILKSIKEIPNNLSLLLESDSSISQKTKQSLAKYIRSLEETHGSYSDQLNLSLLKFQKEYNEYYSKEKGTVSRTKKSLRLSKIAIFISILSFLTANYSHIKQLFPTKLG